MNTEPKVLTTEHVNGNEYVTTGFLTVQNSIGDPVATYSLPLHRGKDSALLNARQCFLVREHNIKTEE